MMLPARVPEFGRQAITPKGKPAGGPYKRAAGEEILTENAKITSKHDPKWSRLINADEPDRSASLLLIHHPPWPCCYSSCTSSCSGHSSGLEAVLLARTTCHEPLEDACDLHTTYTQCACRIAAAGAARQRSLPPRSGGLW